MRAGGSGSRGTRRLPSAVPVQAAIAGVREVRARGARRRRRGGQARDGQARGGQARGGVRFTRGRSDYDNVHQISEIPAARAVATTPMLPVIPWASPLGRASDGPDLRRLEVENRTAGALLARDPLLSDRLYRI